MNRLTPLVRLSLPLTLPPCADVACRTIEAMYVDPAEKVDLVIAAVSVRATEVFRCVMQAAAPAPASEEGRSEDDTSVEGSVDSKASGRSSAKAAPPPQKRTPVHVVPVLLVAYPTSASALRARYLDMDGCAGCFDASNGGAEPRFDGLLEKMGAVLQRYAKVQAVYALLAPEDGREDSYPRVTLVHEIADMNAGADVEKLLDHRFRSRKTALSTPAYRPQLFAEAEEAGSDPAAMVEQSWRASFSDEMKPFILRQPLLPAEARSALGLSKAILEETSFLQSALEKDRRQSSLAVNAHSRRLHHLHRRHVQRRLEIDRELIKHDAAADLLFGEILQPTLRRSSGVSSSRFLSEAQRHWEADRWARAYDCCCRAIAAEPTEAVAYHCRAFVLCRVNQTQRALRDFGISIGLAERQHPLNSFRSKVRAQVSVAKARPLHGYSVWSWSLCVAYDLDMGMEERSAHRADKALQLFYSPAGIHRRRWRSRNSQSCCIIDALHSCIAICPGNLLFVHTRALLLRRLCRYSEAYKDYHQLFQDRLYQDIKDEIAVGGGQEALAKYIKAHDPALQRREDKTLLIAKMASSESARVNMRQQSSLLNRRGTAFNSAIAAHLKKGEQNVEAPRVLEESSSTALKLHSEAETFDLEEGTRHQAALARHLAQLEQQQSRNREALNKVGGCSGNLNATIWRSPKDLESGLESISTTLKDIVSSEVRGLHRSAQPLDEFVRRHSGRDEDPPSTSSEENLSSLDSDEDRHSSSDSNSLVELIHGIVEKWLNKAQEGGEVSKCVQGGDGAESPGRYDARSKANGLEGSTGNRGDLPGGEHTAPSIAEVWQDDSEGEARQRVEEAATRPADESPIDKAFRTLRLKSKKLMLLSRLSKALKQDSMPEDSQADKRKTSMDLAALVLAMDLDHSLSQSTEVLATLKEASSASEGDSTASATPYSKRGTSEAAHRRQKPPPRSTESLGLQEYKALFGSEPSLFSELFEKPSPLQEVLLHDPESRESGHIAEISKFLGTCEQLLEEAPELLARVAEVVEYRTLPEGDSVFIQGEEAYAMAWILSGEIEAYIQEYDMPPSSIGRLGPRRCIGSEALMMAPLVRHAAPRYFASYETTAATELLVILASDFQKLLLEPFYCCQRAKFGYLKRSGIFEDWSMEAIDRLARYARVETFEESTVILRQGDRPDFLYFLVRGICSAQKRPDTVGQLQRKLFDAKETLKKIQTQYSFHHTLRHDARQPFVDVEVASSTSLANRQPRQSTASSAAKLGASRSPHRLLDRVERTKVVLRSGGRTGKTRAKGKAAGEGLTWTERKQKQVETRISMLQRRISYMQQREESSITTIPDEAFEVSRITPVSIFGEACLLNPAEGTSLGTIVAVSPVEVIRVHRKLLHSFEISKQLMKKVEAKAILYPEAAEVSRKLRGASEWVKYRKTILSSVNKRRWLIGPQDRDVHREANRFDGRVCL
eukprot:scaffold1954_cov268-Pinguiococcus_pyrenoidosus.AAC.193